jgi:hypothetical protein
MKMSTRTVPLRQKIWELMKILATVKAAMKPIVSHQEEEVEAAAAAAV